MLLLHEFPLPMGLVAVGGAIVLLIWIVGSIASHQARVRESERQAEKERQEAEQRRLEMELLLRQKDLDLQQGLINKARIRNRGIVLSGCVTVAVYLLTHDLAATAGAGVGVRMLQGLWDD